MKLVPKMRQALNFYDMPSDKSGSGIRTYPWILDQMQHMMDMDREYFKNDTRLVTLNQRGRWERKKRASAAAGLAGGGEGGGGGGRDVRG